MRAVGWVGPSTGVALALALAGCRGDQSSINALSKAEEQEVPIPKVPVPPANGPRLGAIANKTPVYDRPSERGHLLGYLHAGAKVVRAAESFTKDGCPGGWFPIRPGGFVCATGVATVNLEHPTLLAMALEPKLDEPLPYTYARTTKTTTVYVVDAKRDRGIRPTDKIPRNSGFAVVGSWEATDPEGKLQRLAMMTDGRFVAAADLTAAKPSRFEGVPLSKEVELPIAYVVKRGVRAWAVDGQEAEKRALLDYHARFDLTGRYRTLEGLRFWETKDGSWVRHKDVTVVRRRENLPTFVTDNTKWMDISVVTNTMVLYEGHQPIFATLVSVGRDRLGDPKTTDSTTMGEFSIERKHVTDVGLDPASLVDGVRLADAPWVLELSSGQRMLGAYWHDRFGIEDGPGNVQLSPADAAHVWHWVDPVMPSSWHGISTSEDAKRKVIVNIRK